jgi:hypothetical protein
MSLIIQPSQVDQRKTFYALKVLPFLKYNGAPRKHIDADLMAVFCLQAAVQAGCEDIVVCPEGEMPVRFTVQRVQELMRKNPNRYLGWYPKPPQSEVHRRRERFFSRRIMPSRV